MKLTFAVCGLSVFLSHYATAQGTFRNLGFEEANLPYLPPGQSGGRVAASNALPGWTIYGGYTYPDVLYNSEALDSASVSILSTNYSGVLPGLASGTYYVHLRNDWLNINRSAIGQTGQIPASAVTLLLDAAYIFPPAVHFGGVYIPMVEVGTKGQYGSVYGGDISAFAGQIGELRFGGSWFDNIRFSNQPIPEPSAVSFVVLGFCLFRCRSRSCSHESVA